MSMAARGSAIHLVHLERLESTKWAMDRHVCACFVFLFFSLSLSFSFRFGSLRIYFTCNLPISQETVTALLGARQNEVKQTASAPWGNQESCPLPSQLIDVSRD